MNWIELKELNQIETIDLESQQQKILIFKHSTRCAISSAALSRLERNWPETDNHKLYFLDLLSHRDISNLVAEKYSTVHQSPQVLIIEKGKCVFTSSHLDIDAKTILKFLS